MYHNTLSEHDAKIKPRRVFVIRSVVHKTWFIPRRVGLYFYLGFTYFELFVVVLSI
jgi:hypothetical protein